MKLQAWTEVNGQPEECLGEIDVDDETWRNAQACAGDAYELITDLANEIGTDDVGQFERDQTLGD